jgi:two-component sensor histidine kinase
MGAGRDLFALHKDGSEIPVEIGLSPIVTPDGLMALAAVVDISGRKQAEAHRELLLAELNHRVKNTLAVVQSIANQTFKGARTSPEARRAFEARLVTLSRAHDLLTQSHWENAALDDLVADTLEARDANRQRIALSGPRVLLSPRQALGLAMALHELFTNATKYGALSNEAGRVELVWTRSDMPVPRLTLVWRERGGPPVTPPKSQGFGSLLLERALAQDLDGEVATEFNPEGLVCTIAASLGGV